LMLLVGSFDL